MDWFGLLVGVATVIAIETVAGIMLVCWWRSRLEAQRELRQQTFAVQFEQMRTNQQQVQLEAMKQAEGQQAQSGPHPGLFSAISSPTRENP